MSGTRSYKTGLHRRLQDDTYVKHYLQAALGESRPAFLLALRDVMEARNLSEFARQSKLDRVHLYRILSEAGNPTLESLEKILHALNLRLTIEVGVPPAPSPSDETDPQEEQEESSAEVLPTASTPTRRAPSQR
jgi:probable addiction module antidote protein